MLVYVDNFIASYWYIVLSLYCKPIKISMKISLEKEILPDRTVYHIYKNDVWQCNAGTFEEEARKLFKDFAIIEQGTTKPVRVVIDSIEL